MSKHKRLNKFMYHDFGVGGLSNYGADTNNALVGLLATFYGEAFNDVERKSILEFLLRNEGEYSRPQYKHFSREKINELQDEADELAQVYELL